MESFGNMKNSNDESGSSILPPIRSAERRTFDKKIDSVEVLTPLIDEFSFHESVKRNDGRFNQDSTLKKRDVDEMTFKKFEASLREYLKKQAQFLFSNKQLPTKPTEIDMQLASVAERIELSKYLLKKTKARVDDRYLRIKKDYVCRSCKKMHDVRKNIANEE